MTDIDIIDFYNGGAQVTKTTGGTDMTHSFTADGDGETVELGYVPKANSKLVEGAAYDTVEINGVEHLLLKAGHTYDVKLVTGEDEDDINEVIGAPEDHVSLPLPKNVVSVEVTEHVPAEDGDDDAGEAPELGDGTVVEETPSETPEEPTEEQLAEAAANENEAGGTLGTEEGEDAPAETEE